MKTSFPSFFLTATLGLVTLTSQADAANEYVPGRLLVTFSRSHSDAEAKAKVKKFGKLTSFKKFEMFADGKLAILDVAKGKELAAFKNLEKAKGNINQITATELDSIIKPDFIPNDPSFPSQWHLPVVRAPQAWDRTQGSPAIIVAVLDSGVDTNHPDLSSRIVPGKNTFDNSTNTMDDYGHGTKVAGSAVAVSNNGNGIASLCSNCGIMPIKVTYPAGSAYHGMATTSAIAAGIDWARTHGVRVATMSFAVQGYAGVLTSAQAFQAAGGVVTISSGNTGQESMTVATSYALVVGSTNGADSISSFSTYGPALTISAPGEGILTTTNGGGYAAVSGTSFSTPITAGVAALVLSANPQLTGVQARQILIDSADDLGVAGWDKYYGYGRVNAERAVQLAGGTQTDTTPPQVSFASPSASSTLTGSASVSINASDNVGVANVSFYVDGVLKGTDSAAPFTFSLSTETLSNGSHSLSAVAQDTSSNQNSALIDIAVMNLADTIAPSAFITSPGNNASIGRNVSVTGSYSDNKAVVRVDLFVDGNKVGSSTSLPFTIKWNAGKAARGAHNLKTVAFDAAGNSSSSQDVTVNK